mgnify:CR=1 FL=1
MMTRLRRLLASRLHALIARFTTLSRCYLLLWALAIRCFGKIIPREKIIATLSWYAWPANVFSAKTVAVTDAVSFQLVPHVGEHDMRALFTSDLAYEPEVFAALDRIMQGYDAIVEVGANVGFYSLYFAAARRSTDVPVYCFEPSVEAFARLRTNLAINDTPNVFAIPAAVSAVAGLARFYEPAGHLTNGSMVESFAAIFSNDVRATLVPAVSGEAVQSLVQSHQHILLKIDVEGAEIDVLRSLRSFIEDKRPDIVLEVLSTFAADLEQIV